MIKLKSLKLNQLGKSELENREMAQLLGGSSVEACGCGCNGPSSTTSNANTNWNYSYSQSYGDEKRCAYYGDVFWREHF